jgi:hypothetical protein
MTEVNLIYFNNNDPSYLAKRSVKGLSLSQLKRELKYEDSKSNPDKYRINAIEERIKVLSKRKIIGTAVKLGLGAAAIGAGAYAINNGIHTLDNNVHHLSNTIDHDFVKPVEHVADIVKPITHESSKLISLEQAKHLLKDTSTTLSELNGRVSEDDYQKLQDAVMTASKHVSKTVGSYLPHTDENVAKVDAARKAAYEDTL